MKAVTRDVDADGRIDQVVITRVGRVASRDRPIVKVAGYRVLGSVVAVRATRLIVRLAEGPVPDTAATPRVSVASGAVRSEARAVDEAPPMLLAAVTKKAGAKPFAISVTWTEALRADARSAAFRLEASSAPLTVDHVQDALIVLRSARAASPGRLSYRPVGRSGVRDRPGNLAKARKIEVIGTPSEASRPTPAASPSIGAPETAPPAPAPTPTAGPDAPPHLSQDPMVTLADPIDPKFLTGLSFGDRSHWMQPWRGYLETPPAAKLRDALGVNFDVGADRAPLAASLLRRSGFARARIELGWCEVSYDSSSQLRDPTGVRARLSALAAEGLRPLVLLNAHHGCPGPTRSWSVGLTRAARRGDRTIEVDAASAARIEAGRSGLDAREEYKAAAILFTSVNAARRVTLSKPLPTDLTVGPHPASTLRYRPFERPLRQDGHPNANFEETFDGWLRYVDLITRETRAAVGSDAFDVEVWNELGFGSDFLDASTYHEPGAAIGSGDTTRVLLERTVRWLRDPAHGRSGVGIGSGFSSQRPWDSGATSPPGLTALDKHPYAPIRQFPSDAGAHGIRPLDALGRPAGVQEASGAWRDDFVPEYRALFPEYYLSAIQTETLVRDLAPITTSIYGTPHGRSTAPAGSPSPEVWLTEMNIERADFERRAPDSTPSDAARFQAKVALRTLTAYVNKGASAVDFYAATAPAFALIDPGFWAAASDATWSVGDGGATMVALRRLMQAVAGPEVVGPARPLTLDAIGDFAGRAEWGGDGSAAHPALMHRDLLAFLPFQTSASSWAVPIYVMTRDMTQKHGVSGPSDFDLPEERYRLEIGGVTGMRVRARALDPLDGSSVPVEVANRAPGRVVIDMPVTDSPRVLVLSETDETYR